MLWLVQPSSIHLLTRAARDGSELRRAGNSGPSDRRVVRGLEPIEAEVATLADSARKVVTFLAGADTTVCGPTVPATVLRGAACGESTESTARDQDVKVVRAKVAAGVRSLHNHLLPRDRRAGERELVALAAPRLLVRARDGHRGEAVRRVVVDRPGRVVRAGERRAAVAAGLDVRVAQRVLARVARPDGGADGGLAAPSARWLAAVPVARRLPRVLRRHGEGRREGRESGEGYAHGF